MHARIKTQIKTSTNLLTFHNSWCGIVGTFLAVDNRGGSFDYHRFRLNTAVLHFHFLRCHSALLQCGTVSGQAKPHHNKHITCYKQQTAKHNQEHYAWTEISTSSYTYNMNMTQNKISIKVIHAITPTSCFIPFLTIEVTNCVQRFSQISFRSLKLYVPSIPDCVSVNTLDQ